MRYRLLAVLAAIALTAGAGIAARPMIVAALSATGSPDGSAPTVSSVATPPASPSRSVARSAEPTKESDCRDVKDLRRTAAAKKVPFTICGVELINKDHRVSAAYVPKLVTVPVRAYGVPKVQLQPVAAKALVRFFAAAKQAGFTPVVRSSYRNYATQAQWYATMSHARTAPPGASEHQSGLAVDLAGIERGKLVHGTLLASSRTGSWLLEHASDYGFILRYPTSQAKITGIAYEPWHFRYVGKTVAKAVEATKTKTLERYLGVG